MGQQAGLAASDEHLRRDLRRVVLVLKVMVLEKAPTLMSIIIRLLDGQQESRVRKEGHCECQVRSEKPPLIFVG